MALGILYFYDTGALKLGSFTQLNSGNNISDFPTTYNANLAKTIEMGTTTVGSIISLPNFTGGTGITTLGTISTGVWNGTAITVPFGGTGSTTLSANGVLLGNGTSNIKSLACANSAFLTWTAGFPACGSTSVDQAANYSWTGQHSFTNATTTGWQGITGTLNFTGIWNSPAASSTVASKDAAGHVYWVPGGLQEVYNVTLGSPANSIDVQNIPARSHIHVILSFGTLSADATEAVRFNADTGNNYNVDLTSVQNTTVVNAASTTVSNISFETNTHNDSVAGEIVLDITNTATQNKIVSFKGYRFKAGTQYKAEGGAAWTNTSNAINRITFLASASANFPTGSQVIVYVSQN